MSTYRRPTRLLSAVLGLALLLAAQASAASAADRQKTPVSVRFSWKLKGEYAPLYVALDQGYFAQEGLDVKLGEGAGSQAALASVIKDQDQAVWLPGIFALQAISKGVPVKLVALYNPAAPIAIISWPDKPIRTPKELEGKNLATAVGETGTNYLSVLCEKNRIDCSKINLVNMAPDARVPAFIARKVDAVSVYRTNDLPILVAKHGRNFVELDEAEWGLRVPGSAFVASNEYIARHPNVLAGLIRAVNKGIRFSQSNPKAAAEIMLKYWPASLSTEVVAEQVDALVKAVPDYRGKPMGWTDEALIADALKALKAAGEVSETKPLDAYYTNAIVEMAGRASGSGS